MFWSDLKLKLDCHYGDDEVSDILNKIKDSHSHRPRAAILIALFLHCGEVYTILTKRSSHLKTHAGEVCFPGGKVDISDKNLFHTAQREAWEEIGLEDSHIEILGQLMPIISKNGILVFPVVACLTNIENIRLKLNTNEVEDIFACPLQFFLDSPSEKFNTPRLQSYSYNWIKNYSLSNKKFGNNFLQLILGDCKYASHVIFGLTAMYCIIIAGFCLHRSVTVDIDIAEMIAKTKRYVLQELSGSSSKL